MVKMLKKAANTKKPHKKSSYDTILLVTFCQVEETSHSFYSKSFQNHLSILLLMYLALDHIVF